MLRITPFLGLRCCSFLFFLSFELISRHHFCRFLLGLLLFAFLFFLAAFFTLRHFHELILVLSGCHFFLLEQLLHALESLDQLLALFFFLRGGAAGLRLLSF